MRRRADQTVAKKTARAPKRRGFRRPEPAASRPSRRRAARPSQNGRAPKPEPPAAPPLAPLGRRERSQLSRGRKEIDARLDLHGMTQTRAHRALSDFLQRAHVDGLTFVLVITGKGSTRRRNRARRAAPPGAAMAEPAGIPHPGGRLRGSAYRPWRRGRAVCADQAGKSDEHQNGRTIPTRGIMVTIQPNMVVFGRPSRSAAPRAKPAAS